MEKNSNEIIAAIRAKYPKFSKVQLCMVRNPAYGVTLSPGAKRLIKDKTKKSKPKKKAKQLTLRVTDYAYEKINEEMEKRGIKSYQELIEGIINKALGE